MALGYEDLNDHDSLRKDLLWQAAAERNEELASCSTLCRLENRAGRKEVLLEALRRIGLKGTELARAQVTTIRLGLLTIGAVITRNTRRIRLYLSSSFPLQELFCSCLVRFYG